MIARLFADDERRRSQAFGLLAFVGAAGASIGVVAGGLLVDLASWRWVFLVNVPIGARDPGRAAPPRPAARPARSAPGPAVWCRGHCFRAPRFVVANGVLLTMTMAGFSFQFLSALYLQDVLGLDPLATGLSYLPVTVAIAVSSLVLSGRLAERYGAARVLVAGLVLFVGGLLLLARTPGTGRSGSTSHRRSSSWAQASAWRCRR